MRLRARYWVMLLMVGIAITCSSFAQREVAHITSAVKASSAEKISLLFDRMVDITINNTFNTYSKAQGEMVLDNFFKKQKVKSYNIIHSGQSNNGQSQYLISQLLTKKGQLYKLFFLLKKKDNNHFLIQSIRIEEG